MVWLYGESVLNMKMHSDVCFPYFHTYILQFNYKKSMEVGRILLRGTDSQGHCNFIIVPG